VSRFPLVSIDKIRSSSRYSLVGGPFGSELTSKDYTEDGVPVIRGVNLPEEREFLDDDFVFVSQQKADSLNANMGYPGDLVFTQRGTLGQIGIIPAKSNFPRYVISQSQMKLTVDSDLVMSKYVYYFFKSPFGTQMIKSHALASGVPHINLGILKAFKLPLPPLSFQKRIVTILSAYDDLIENNRRRMAKLEEAARLLYQEWFVRLRFPGHERTRIVNGVPEGWTKKALEEVCSDQRKAVLPQQLRPDTPYIGLEHMPRRSICLQEWGSVEDVTSSKLVFQENDILFGKIRPYFHKVGFALVDGVTSSDAIVVRPVDASLFSLILMTMSSDRFVAQTSQSSKEGSKMPRADWKQMKAWPLLVPNSDILWQFEDVISTITRQLRTLALQTRALRAARDLLLPRLMSGEIAV